MDKTVPYVLCFFLSIPIKKAAAQRPLCGFLYSNLIGFSSAQLKADCAYSASFMLETEPDSR